MNYKETVNKLKSKKILEGKIDTKFIFYFFLTVLLFSSGCASYKVQNVKVEPAGFYRNKSTISNVTIAVDPYDNPTKAESVFYVDLTKKNIKPIHLIVQNNSEDNLEIARTQILLVDNMGNDYQPVNSIYVFNQFEHNELLYAILGFGIWSYMSADEANEKMQADWSNKELPEERIIKSKRKASGFVFYETDKDLQGLIINIDVLNLNTNENLEFEIPIS